MQESDQAKWNQVSWKWNQAETIKNPEKIKPGKTSNQETDFKKSILNIVSGDSLL